MPTQRLQPSTPLQLVRLWRNTRKRWEKNVWMQFQIITDKWSLTVPHLISKHDQGNYTCVVSNVHGLLQRTVFVEVVGMWYSPLFILHQSLIKLMSILKKMNFIQLFCNLYWSVLTCMDYCNTLSSSKSRLCDILRSSFCTKGSFN